MGWLIGCLIGKKKESVCFSGFEDRKGVSYRVFSPERESMEKVAGPRGEDGISSAKGEGGPRETKDL